MMLKQPATFWPFEKFLRIFLFWFDLLTCNGFAIALCKETNDMNFNQKFFFCIDVANGAVSPKILLQVSYCDSLSGTNLLLKTGENNVAYKMETILYTYTVP